MVYVHTHTHTSIRTFSKNTFFELQTKFFYEAENFTITKLLLGGSKILRRLLLRFSRYLGHRKTPLKKTGFLNMAIIPLIYNIFQYQNSWKFFNICTLEPTICCKQKDSFNFSKRSTTIAWFFALRLGINHH